jgi:hypothetical protein
MDEGGEGRLGEGLEKGERRTNIQMLEFKF